MLQWAKDVVDVRAQAPDPYRSTFFSKLPSFATSSLILLL